MLKAKMNAYNQGQAKEIGRGKKTGRRKANSGGWPAPKLYPLWLYQLKQGSKVISSQGVGQK